MTDLHSTAESRRLADNDDLQRGLCHRLLDAIEAGDLDTFRDCFHPDASFWVNLSRPAGAGPGTVDSTIEALRAGARTQRRRTYNDRRVDVLDDGFLARFSINVVRHDGTVNCLWACVVARTRHGRIVQFDEYLDSGRFGAAPTPAPADVSEPQPVEVGS